MANRQPAPDIRKLREQWGHMLPDATAILGAIDVVFGECDR
tara:strand:- start:192 stop:314 length:123 start_codon:yes stop_codon:yes gene_type:complete